MYNQVIVVGGGLSGLSAAHTNSFFCGNSTKATSGINGVLTKTQIALGVQDSAEIFAQDTARSARDLAHPDLIKEKFKLDLPLVSRLGGYFQPRTHRGKEMFPGMKITYALMEGIEEIVNNQPDRARLIKKARVTKLIKEGDAVIGVKYVKDGQTCKEYGPVILATGGYAADFTEDPLLKKYRPDIYNLPTTNGEGDVPDAKIKFLAAEALWGVGGLLLNSEGKRFCDELGHRLVLNSKASKKIEWHFKHYVGRGLMRKFSGEALAKEICISASQLKAKRILLARKFFHNVPITINDQFHGGIDINAESEVRDMQEQVIPGLFASGEIAGGVHGANRLGGSSLLGCVIYGRVADLSSATANRRLGQIARQLAPYQTTVSVDPTNQKVHLEISWGSHKDATSQYTPPVQAPQALPSQAPAPEKKADAPTREKRNIPLKKSLSIIKKMTVG
ncbi:hypothetical protein C2G38_2134492 [Gigaspora rosea]|uniref:FAD-dependent oxidoreductase 2 FAD-binding domain-containing protein n=1 Tax=Gigaspora rosea TaxID=44941 RepID=A0A397V763_9GLOM|nr:hypothetical protein C2G38_2134492 [Gigaspora rosea]